MSVFFTGATGFVGGSILLSLCSTHPEVHVRTLIRRDNDAKELQSIYPNIHPVIGSLSDLAILRAEAAKVDFVVHAASEDIPAVRAMIDGLSLSFPMSPAEPRLISITGPRSLIDVSLPITGIARDIQPWSDTADIKELLTLPKSRIHAEADQDIVAHSKVKGVGTMLISPGQLLGRPGGPAKKQSAAAMYFNAVKSLNKAFIVGDGSVAWSWVSTGDLGNAVVFLMDQALTQDNTRRSEVGINDEGYYFVRTGDLSMVERAEAISKRLCLGPVQSLPVNEVAEIHPFAPMMWGCGATFRSDRLALLGWRPKDTDWKALMEEEGGRRA